MIIEQKENTNTSALQAPDQYGVLVADPGGKLKLARWRLQSDGYRVYYIRDLSAMESLIGRGEIQVILLSIGGPGDLQLLERINKMQGHFRVVAITAGKTEHMSKMIFAMGVRKTVSRPIDYPQLSAVVRQEIESLREQSLKKNIFDRTKKFPNIPLNIRTIYRTLLDHVKTGIVAVDAAGSIVYINRPMSELLGLDEEGAASNYFTEIFPDFSQQCELLTCSPHSSCPGPCSIRAILVEAFENREKCHRQLKVSKDGREPVVYEAKGSPIYDKTGEFTGAFVELDELANSGKLERVMAQSEKLAMVGQLAAGAAHEIKNPLTSVKGFIQLLQKELENTPKGDYINIIIAEIDRVNTIINEFLKLAKPAEPYRKQCHLRELVDDVRLLVESEAFLKHIEIEEDISVNLPLVFVDCEQIKQVLINVIRNSFEAMTKGGIITVKAFELPAERELCLQITDTGMGMDEETVNRIFVPFYTTKENGTGLGLAVSSEIMKNHGGRMEVESQVGQGTSVYLYFSY